MAATSQNSTAKYVCWRPNSVSSYMAKVYNSTALAQPTTKDSCSCCGSTVRVLAGTTVNLTAVLRVLSQHFQLNAWIGASNRPRQLFSQSVLTHRRCVAGVSSQTSIGRRNLGARLGKSHACITHCTFALSNSFLHLLSVCSRLVSVSYESTFVRKYFNLVFISTTLLILLLLLLLLFIYLFSRLYNVSTSSCAHLTII
jgi:hypothetical protein